MKKRCFYIALVLICLSLVTSSTWAYFTTSDVVRNVITAGGVDVSVVEYQLVDGALKPFPQDPVPVMPGMVVSKVVTVRCNEQPAWVRANYTLTLLDAEGNKMDISEEELNKLIHITPDTANWTCRDGWWYYNTHLSTGESTKPLFQAIGFSGVHMGNKYQQSKLLVDVYTQAVQQAHNGETVMEALGWPAN